MEKELADLEERKRLEDEERRRREMQPEPRKWYIPLKGDPIDEMMAKYLNECPHYVPVKRLGEGQYMYGSKKIFAKIMNGKLVIRVGGGYMLIDEFLKNFAEQEGNKADYHNESMFDGSSASPTRSPTKRMASRSPGSGKKRETSLGKD
jgi:hypothetical protein